MHDRKHLFTHWQQAKRVMPKILYFIITKSVFGRKSCKNNTNDECFAYKNASILYSSPAHFSQCHAERTFFASSIHSTQYFNCIFFTVFFSEFYLLFFNIENERQHHRNACHDYTVWSMMYLYEMPRSDSLAVYWEIPKILAMEIDNMDRALKIQLLRKKSVHSLRMKYIWRFLASSRFANAPLSALAFI